MSATATPLHEGRTCATAYQQLFSRNIATQMHICNGNFFQRPGASSPQLFKEVLLSQLHICRTSAINCRSAFKKIVKPGFRYEEEMNV
jgi:hypothetical protein